MDTHGQQFVAKPFDIDDVFVRAGKFEVRYLPTAAWVGETELTRLKMRAVLAHLLLRGPASARELMPYAWPTYSKDTKTASPTQTIYKLKKALVSSGSALTLPALSVLGGQYRLEWRDTPGSDVTLRWETSWSDDLTSVELRSEGLCLRFEALVVRYDGRLVPLYLTSARILVYLLRQAGYRATKRDICGAVWPNDVTPDNKKLHSAIYNLNRQLMGYLKVVTPIVTFDEGAYGVDTG